MLIFWNQVKGREDRFSKGKKAVHFWWIVNMVKTLLILGNEKNIDEQEYTGQWLGVFIMFSHKWKKLIANKK